MARWNPLEIKVYEVIYKFNLKESKVSGDRILEWRKLGVELTMEKRVVWMGEGHSGKPHEKGRGYYNA